MKIMPNTTTERNQRITARFGAFGQVAAIERSLVEDPGATILLQRVAAARGAMSGLMTYLIEEVAYSAARLRRL